MNNYGKITSGRDRASNLFEERCNPNKMNFDLERIRRKNISKIREIADETSYIKGIYNRDYSNMSEAEKNKFISKELRHIDDIINQKLLQVKYNIRDEINHQAKMLLLLARKGEKSQVFEYYKLINTMPLFEPYSDYEKELYDEFVLSHSDINNIIIGYSELESNNLTSDNTDASVKAAVEALEIAEKSIELEDWIKAEQLVLAISNTGVRASLITRFKKLIEAQAKCFDNLLTSLMLKVNAQEIIETDLVRELSKRYQLLTSDKKSTVKNDTKLIIDYSNTCVQDSIKDDIANQIENDTIDWKYSVGQRIIEFIGMPVNWIRRSSSYLKHILNKRANATGEKQDKYNNIYLERDNISGPIYYANVNKLNSMKPLLYRTTYSERGPKLQESYYRTMASVYNKMNRSVDYMMTKEKNDIIGDEKRAINVINQYMRMISIYDINKEGDIDNDQIFAGLIEDVKDLLLKTKDAGTINEDLYNAYLEELGNIVLYKHNTPNSRTYEYRDSDIIEMANNKGDLPFVKVR